MVCFSGSLSAGGFIPPYDMTLKMEWDSLFEVRHKGLMPYNLREPRIKEF